MIVISGKFAVLISCVNPVDGMRSLIWIVRSNSNCSMRTVAQSTRVWLCPSCSCLWWLGCCMATYGHQPVWSRAIRPFDARSTVRLIYGRSSILTPQPCAMVVLLSLLVCLLFLIRVVIFYCCNSKIHVCSLVCCSAPPQWSRVNAIISRTQVITDEHWDR